MPKPPRLTDAEAEALKRYFRHVYLGYDDARKPLHDLLLRIDLYVSERDLEAGKVAS